MEIQDIIAFELSNAGTIHLFLEGIFWKAYEQSAYLFYRNVESFAVKKRMIKKIQKDVVSLGFPKASLNKLFDVNKIVMIVDRYLPL